MKQSQRIAFDPQVMGGKPCIRGKRVTVGTIVGLIATGETIDDILAHIHILNEKILWRHCRMLLGDQKKELLTKADIRETV